MCSGSTRSRLDGHHLHAPSPYILGGFSQGFRQGGAGDHRWQEEKEVLRTGDRTDSCPQKTEAVMPVSGAYRGMSYLLFQELTVISTAVLTKADCYFQHSPGFWLCSRYSTKHNGTEQTTP